MMSNIFFIADPHFGHEGVCRFLREDGSKLRPWEKAADMDEALIERWNSVVGVNDKVYCLGDIVMKKEFLPIMTRLKGKKNLVRGNHDIFPAKEYLKYFYDIHACRVLEDMILTHIPIHRECMGNYQTNVHGHLHYRSLNDPDYICVSMEHIDYTPIELGELRARITAQKIKASAGESVYVQTCI
jgi:calcineurin-like phosphoesterase family protein